MEVDGEGGNLPQASRRRQLHPLRPASQAFADDRQNTRRSRSPQGLRSGADSAPENAPFSIASMVDAELGRYLAPAVLKDMRKQSMDLSNKIRALQRTNARREKLKKDIHDLTEERLPPGYRPFPHTFETYLLDEMVVQEGLSRQVDQSCSIRDTKRKFHLEHLKVQCELDLQLLERHRVNLKQHIRKEAFIDRCMQHFPGRDVESAANFLDIDDSDNEATCAITDRGLSREQCTAKILAIYRKVVDAEAEAKRVEVDKQAAEVRKHQRVVQEVVEKSPEQFLIEAIDSRIAASKTKPKSKPARKKPSPSSGFEINQAGLAAQSFSGMMDPTIAADFVVARKGTGKSGKGTGRPTLTDKGKGKGKTVQLRSKGKAKGEGKSKSKGAPPQPTVSSWSKNGPAPRKGGKGKSKTQQPPKGKGRGSKGSGKGSWFGSGKGNWQ